MLGVSTESGRALCFIQTSGGKAALPSSCGMGFHVISESSQQACYSFSSGFAPYGTLLATRAVLFQGSVGCTIIKRLQTAASV